MAVIHRKGKIIHRIKCGEYGRYSPQPFVRKRESRTNGSEKSKAGFSQLGCRYLLFPSL
jgi:hypothetical protein